MDAADSWGRARGRAGTHLTLPHASSPLELPGLSLRQNSDPGPKGLSTPQRTIGLKSLVLWREDKCRGNYGLQLDARRCGDLAILNGSGLQAAACGCYTLSNETYTGIPR